MFKVNKNSHPAIKLLIILLGSALYAVAIGLFLDPNQLAPGGVTGIAIIINHITGLPTGALIMAMSVPLLVVGMWKFGVKFLLSTLLAIVLSSVAIDLLAPYGPVTEDKLLAAVAGGVLLAVGMGLIFKVGATTGGMDIVARLLKLKFKHISTGRLFLLTDSVVVLASAIAFHDIDVALYAALTVIINSTVFDMMLYGADGAKLVYIITEKEAVITRRILDELEIGVTRLKGSGAYTDTEKQVILCATRKQQLPQLQEIATGEDPCAFLIITSASEVFGEGFKDAEGEPL